jgi:hypothetical protein
MFVRHKYLSTALVLYDMDNVWFNISIIDGFDIVSLPCSELVLLCLASFLVVMTFLQLWKTVIA